MSKSEIVLGIDPGFGRVGYGLVERGGRNDWHALDWGCIETSPKKEFVERLQEICDAVTALIKKYQPEIIAVEELFFFKNVTTAIQVGQARGVILLAGVQAGLKICEFTPLQVKQSLTGYGRAEKAQMQKMVAMLLGIKGKIKSDDAADALAIALAAGQTARFERRVAKSCR